MQIGMLWFDNDVKVEMPVKVQRAAAYYQRKYGQQPNLCYVHPSMINGEKLQTGGVEVRTTKSVLPHHFWIGVSNEQAEKLSAFQLNG